MVELRHRELTDSFRLAIHGERWFVLDVIVAVLAFVGWVAGTGALAVTGGDAAGFSLSIDPGTTRTRALIAAAFSLWVLLPALLATSRLRSRVTNVSGNVASEYRFDSPGALLGPPAALLAVVAVAALASPLKWPALAVALPVGAYLLARTAAFSYRVYSFSYPLLVHVAAFCTFLLFAAVGVLQLSSVADRPALVGDALASFEVPIDVYGHAGSGLFSFPTVLTVAAATPVVLVGLYLALHALVAAYVRRIEPTVDRANLRAGQRNPFQSAVANGAGRPTATPGATTTPAGSEGEGAGVGAVHVQTTRVYTTDDDDVTDRSGIESGTASRGGQQCRTCGAAFTAGTEVRFCPNCGQRLDDS